MEPKSGRRVNAFHSDLAVLLLIGAVVAGIHTLTNGQYGFHRDELQTFDDARHLDWGFVAYPPVMPLIARLELTLFGPSLIGFRFFAAVAVGGVAVLAGLIAKEIGGRRREQILAAIAVAIAPISLVQGAVLQYVSFDYLWGAAAAYFLVRLLNSNDPRWWVAIGLTLGIGMETRYTMGFLALGIASAVALSPDRRYLRSGWLWLGVALSILVLLPNLIWQMHHHFISLEFLSHIHARDLRQGRYHEFYREQLLVCANPVTAPLAALGLWFYFVRRESRPYRLLGWLFAVTFLLYSAAGARSYYTAPLYPMLLAAGCVMLEKLLAGLNRAISRTVYGVQWAGIVLGGIAFGLLTMPIAPIGSAIWKVTSKLHDQFREELGWPELADATARVYNSLPEEERQHTGILAGNYGEGGALNLYGPALGLPHAMSLTNSFWYRGYDPRLPQTVILAGFDLDEGRELFENCVVAAENSNQYGVENEESRDHPDILLCRKPRFSWPVYWERSRRFG